MVEKTRKNKGKTYETHDNGGRSFFVTVNGKKVSVEKNMDTYELVNGKFTTIHKPSKQLFEKTVDAVFIGKKSPTGGYDGLRPSEAEGNSILLRDDSKYIFIGHEIFEFKPIEGDTIKEFYSNIGGSDVPYPYAIGTSYVYLMLDKVAVEKSFFDMKAENSFFRVFDRKKGIYEQYYFVDHALDMCLRGYGDAGDCKDKKKAREQIKDLKEKTTTLKTKLIQKRL